MTGHSEANAAADRRRFLFGSALALGMLAWGIADAWPFVSDDAFISLRYAERLLSGQGLTWTDGPPVEGYSNLAWVLGTALLAAGGLDLLLAARALGIACTVAMLLLLGWRYRATMSGALLPVVAAAAAPSPVWAIGGLEMPLLLLLLTAGFLGLEGAGPESAGRRRPLVAGVWFGLACLTRPDAPLFAALAIALASWQQWRAHRRTGPAFAAAAWLALPVALSLLAQLAFRLAYYGDLLPNTARVKLAVGAESFRGGWIYLQAALPVLWPLLPLAALGAASGWRRPAGRAPALAHVAAAASWCVYVAAVAGDIFPAWRLLLPALLPLWLLTGMASESATTGARRWLALLATVLAAALLRVLALADEQTRRAQSERWEFDNEAIGRTLASAFAGQEPLLAVDAAGALPFYAALPALDMFGLNDATIARDRERVAAKSAYLAAHHRGSPDYLLGRMPDLLYFDRVVPDDPSGMALLDDARFEAGYRCVWFRCAEVTHDRTLGAPDAELQAPIWVRLEGRIGCRRDDRRVVVPAWLLGSYRHPPGMRPPPPASDAEALRQWQATWQREALLAAEFAARSACARLLDGALVLEVRRPGRRSLTGLRLPAGAWRLQPSPPAPHCVAELLAADGSPLPRAGDAFVLAAEAVVELRLEVAPAAALPLTVRELDLRRE